MGVPMLLLALSCILWTLWLIILTIVPNSTANYLMNTQAFDNGTFWLIINPEPVLMIISVIGLSVVIAGYIYVIALMTISRNIKRHQSSHDQSPLRNFCRPLRQRENWFDCTINGST